MDTVTEGVPAATGSASLFAKMAKVMGKMSRIGKDGTHPTQHYKFVTDADVLDRVRVAMAEENLALFPSMVEVVSEKIGETQYKNPIMRHVARFVFTFADGESGATYSCVWHGECNDTSDKGISKAATAALKYFLLKTFLISTGDAADDPDHQEDIEDYKPAKPKAQPKPASPPQPALNVVKNENGGAVVQTPLGAGAGDTRKIDTAEQKPWPQVITLAASNSTVTGLYSVAKHRTGMFNLLLSNGILHGGLELNKVVERVSLYHDAREHERSVSKKNDEDQKADVIAALKQQFAPEDLKPTG